MRLALKERRWKGEGEGANGADLCDLSFLRATRLIVRTGTQCSESGEKSEEEEEEEEEESGSGAEREERWGSREDDTRGKARERTVE